MNKKETINRRIAELKALIKASPDKDPRDAFEITSWERDIAQLEAELTKLEYETVVPLYADTLYVDIYRNGEFICTANAFTELDIRRQICEKNLEGYSMKIAPMFMRLFHEEDNIKDFVVNIDSNGEVDRWFPEYYINEDYPSVGVFGTTLKAAIKFRRAQKEKTGE